jgi:hypothetical protein
VTAGEQSNLAALEGCKQWARNSHEGRDFKLGLCDQQFVNSNWGNFARKPQ